MSIAILHKDKTPIAFKAQAGEGCLNLEIYDVIGQDFFGEGITASMVSDAIKNAESLNGVHVSLNSPGGDLFEGVAIYNLLKACGKPVSVNVLGLAASAASLVAMAGDTITMQLGTQMMVHEAIAITAGFAADMRKMADILDSVTASAADIYVAKTGLSKEKVLALMADETWMSPEDAMKNGFATSISKNQGVKNSFDLSVFKNVPQELKNLAKTKEVDGEHLTAGDFIYVGDPDKTDTWSLPWHFSTEEKTKSHLRDALARFDQDKVIPESHKAEAYAKLVRLCKEHGIEVSEKKNEAESPADYKIPLLRKRLEIEKRK
jgi:ATP-dependent protease ClpP protease subunit